MPNPKRKHSKQRTRIRRAHQALSLPGLIDCPRCGQPTLPHKVCGTCEHYKGKEYTLRRPEKTS